MNINKEILKTIKYFSFFAYQPTLKEIHTFLRVKISKKELKAIFRHTPPQYSIGRKILNIKYQISKRKLQNWRYRSYIKLLSLFPQIKLVGLSGSIAMMNAKEDDDIDLFVITAKNRLFTGRFIALMLAQVMGLRRNRKAGVSQVAKNLYPSLSQSNHKDKVCLNLFFDESNLKVPKFKQTEFVGHEVLQMKPVINKDRIYERFLEANEWVFRLFPNAKKTNSKVKTQNSKTQFKNQNIIEVLLRKFQLYFINRHKTTEIITKTQLWFHPDDFGKKILTDY